MVLKGINFKSLVLAGFVAGYVMYFVDKWLGGFLGLFSIFPGTKNAWWMLEHHIDGIIIALLFAWPAVHQKLPGGGWLKGSIFGLAWAIVLFIIMLIGGALGSKAFQQIPVNATVAISNFLLHIIYGFFLGILYVPPAEERTTERLT